MRKLYKEGRYEPQNDNNIIAYDFAVFFGASHEEALMMGAAYDTYKDYVCTITNIYYYDRWVLYNIEGRKG